ncbi:MAG: hypothetical protein GY881_15775 [Gammaproteobacteria bacterium]|nr:hypothetical protein [Gammaproteobacteria bacterium]
MKIEISKQAFEALIKESFDAAIDEAYDTGVNDAAWFEHLYSMETGDGWTRTTSTVHDMLLTVVTNCQGSQPITQYYLTDINA